MPIYGVDKNYIQDALYGLGIAVAFILAGKIFPFIGAIGIPTVATSVAGNLGRFIIIVIVAAVSEEIFFREFLLDFFDEKLKAYGLDLPYFVAA